MIPVTRFRKRGKMILVADVGNTTITIGLYDDDKLAGKWSFSTDVKKSEDEYGILFYNILKYNKFEKAIDGAIISSVVVQLTDRIKAAFEKYFGVKPVMVSYKINTGIKIKIKNPQEISADRIVNAYYTSKFYKLPAVVVDFGTATSFDVINEKSEFIGGIIAAGMKIQANALSEFTSKLPKLRIEDSKCTIADNTIDAMLSGIVRGQAAMIDGLISACEKELGKKVTTIATGGYCNTVAKYMTRPFDAINENLVLDGLYELWKINR